jgi:hypothetical protein
MKQTNATSFCIRGLEKKSFQKKDPPSRLQHYKVLLKNLNLQDDYKANIAIFLRLHVTEGYYWSRDPGRDQEDNNISVHCREETEMKS